VRFLETVAERAGRNHQPLTQAMWEHNQRTGYFGTLRPGAIGRRKKLFGTPGRKRRKPKWQNRLYTQNRIARTIQSPTGRCESAREPVGDAAQPVAAH
jgi:hypothetical protein